MTNRYLDAGRQGKNSVFRFIGGIVFIFIFMNILSAVMIGVYGGITGDFSGDFKKSSMNVRLALNLLMFGFAFMAIMITIKKIHKRPFKTLITPNSRVDYRKILYSGFVYFMIMIAADVVQFLIYPDNYKFTFDIKQFIPLLLISLILIPIQTSAEEFFFRGYLTQNIGLITRLPWIPLVITSLMFGFAHYSNPEVKTYGAMLMMPNYIGMGVILSLAALADEGLELPLGIHAANNIYCSLIVTFSSSVLETQAIFKTQDYHPLLSLITFFAGCILYILIVFRNDKDKLARVFKQHDSI